MNSSTDQSGNAQLAPSQTSENQQSGQAVILFPTVCFVAEHHGVEQMNGELERFCLDQEGAQPRLETGSIQGGYHSNRQLFEHDNAAVQRLKGLLIGDSTRYLKEYWQRESTIPLANIEDVALRITGWSVVLRQGDMSTPHTHPGAHLSGVYYVKTNDQDQQSRPGAGELALVDPRIRAGVAPISGQKSNAMFTPKAGVVIMFPSYLEHFVLPFKGDGERISIAFNVSLSPNALQRD